MAVDSTILSCRPCRLILPRLTDIPQRLSPLSMAPLPTPPSLPIASLPLLSSRCPNFAKSELRPTFTPSKPVSLLSVERTPKVASLAYVSTLFHAPDPSSLRNYTD